MAIFPLAQMLELAVR